MKDFFQRYQQLCTGQTPENLSITNYCNIQQKIIGVVRILRKELREGSRISVCSALQNVRVSLTQE